MVSATVIVPAFNQAALTAQCVGKLVDLCQVIVVDDGSTDATPAALAGFGRRIQVVTNPKNLGFAESCNAGARQARGGYLVFLNNDTIPQPGWLEALVRYAEAHPRAAVVGSKLVYPNRTIQHAGVVICRDRYPRHIYAGFPVDHPAVNKSRRYQVVTGACMLIRAEVFSGAGGFDPAFHNGFEDVDLCLRLGQKGHEIHYCAESLVEHLESASPGRFRHEGHNVTLYRERWLERVRPDDLDYYLEDGLLRLSYEGRYPFLIEFSPFLATVNEAERRRDLENLLQVRTRELAEVQRENTRLRLELGMQSQESPELQYQELRQQIRHTVRQLIPAGSTVLVASKGDGALVDLPQHRAWHFPQTEHGSYAGHHPADSAEAVAALEALRGRGAAYLLIPSTCLWWLDHYKEFRRHLETCHTRLAVPDGICAIYRLEPPRIAAAACAETGADLQYAVANSNLKNPGVA
jgi:GT2 family glycosyltransferase